MTTRTPGTLLFVESGMVYEVLKVDERRDDITVWYNGHVSLWSFRDTDADLSLVDPEEWQE